MKIPIVTIVGRPNVGKSTLFNKIAGKRIAITAEEEGTTRDRLFHKVEHPEMDFFLVDTGGLDFGKGDTPIEDNMQLQARVAIEESDLIVFVVSGNEALVSPDFSAAELLRKKSGEKPILFIANKCDRPLDDSELAPLYELGLSDPLQISALHRTGLDMLQDRIIKELKGLNFIPKSDPNYAKVRKWEATHANIAVVGKPNVGKSSLVNALLNQNKLVVSEIPGTTRDATDSVIRHEGKDYNFIDTAGLRRRGKIERGIEKFSVLRSMEAIERCDIALLVIDSSEAISHQDQQIANYIISAGRGLIILVNKWDIKDEEDEEKGEKRQNKFISKLRYKFPFLSWAPAIFTSAVTKKNLSRIFGQIDLILEERKKRIQTAQLNTFVQKLLLEHAPTGTSRTRPKLLYITQPEVNPPRFILFVNKKQAFHFSYLRYIENRLREKFRFTGTPIALEYREKGAKRFDNSTGKT